MTDPVTTRVPAPEKHQDNWRSALVKLAKYLSSQVLRQSSSLWEDVMNEECETS